MVSANPVWRTEILPVDLPNKIPAAADAVSGFFASLENQSRRALNTKSLSFCATWQAWQSAVAGGLLPVQWSILSYLRDANRYSNTPQALADYLALTKGTVSQRLKLLAAHGWIDRQPDPLDRRIVRLAITPAGREQLDDNTGQAWLDAIAELPGSDRQAAEKTLSNLLRSWQKSRSGRTFGVCKTCSNFCPGKPEHRCGLTGEALSNDDSQQICREHTTV